MEVYSVSRPSSFLDPWPPFRRLRLMNSSFDTDAYCVSRCFGDKGDVEDITEGTCKLSNTTRWGLTDSTQQISFPRWSSTRRATTLPLVTKAAE
jgi:hypothetical protein